MTREISFRLWFISRLSSWSTFLWKNSASLSTRWNVQDWKRNLLKSSRSCCATGWLEAKWKASGTESGFERTKWNKGDPWCIRFYFMLFLLLSKRMCNSPEVYSAIHLGSGGNAWEDLQQHLYTLGAMGGVDGSLWTLRYEWRRVGVGGLEKRRLSYHRIGRKGVRGKCSGNIFIYTTRVDWLLALNEVRRAERSDIYADRARHHSPIRNPADAAERESGICRKSTSV